MFDERDSPAFLLYFDNYDILLELSMDYQFSDLVCFLAETDRIRLPDDASPSTSRQMRIFEQYSRKLTTIVKEGDPENSQTIAAVLSASIPFPTIFASLCETAFNKMLQIIRDLPVSMIMRRITPKLDECKPELSSTLKNECFRKYYELFLETHRPAVDVGSLRCWDEINRLLLSIDRYVLPAKKTAGSTEPSAMQSAASTYSPSSHHAVSAVPSAAPEKRHSMAASKGAVDALVTGLGGTAASASESALLGETLSDPLEVFSLLLMGMRQLQRRFFASGAGVAQNEKAASVAVAGVSEALRMDLATTLSMTASVRANDIESVDSAFAAACAGRILRILRSAERETFQHLQLQYSEFIQSAEYFSSLAVLKTESSHHISQYRSLCQFLGGRVLTERLVAWTDFEAFGKTFLHCPPIESIDEKLIANDVSFPARTTTVLLRGHAGWAPPGSPVAKMWAVSGGDAASPPSCKLANPFAVPQEKLRDIISGVWEIAKSQLPQESGEACISILLDSNAAVSCKLLSLLGFNVQPDHNPGNCWIALACRNGTIGLACAVNTPPCTPLIEGLRAACRWALDPTSDCQQYRIVTTQLFAAGPVPLLDIYNLGMSDRSARRQCFGICDVSIREVVDSLGPRLILQILLLLLTNRSILLISRCVSRLSRILAVLPRLAWPFSICKTHGTRHFSFGHELQEWAQNELSVRAAAWMASCSTTAYDSLSAETKGAMAALQGAGTAGGSHTGLFLFDVDSCSIVNPTAAKKTQCFSKLTDPSNFKRLNSNAYRRLHQSVKRAEDDAACEAAFIKYMIDIFLRYLPPTVHHYPEHRVIACDVRKLLSDLPRITPNYSHCDAGLGAEADIEVEFVTELVGLSSASFIQLLGLHDALFKIKG